MGEELRFNLELPENVSRNSRYFNMLWFKHKEAAASRQLSFGQMVSEVLDPTRYRITASDKGDRYLFKIWALNNGRIDAKEFRSHPGNCKSIVIAKNGNVLSMRKKYCWQDRFLYAIAIKVNLLSIPKKWLTINKVCQCRGIRVTFQENVDNDSVAFCITDKFYNKVRIPVESVGLINDYLMLARQLSRLRQFNGLKTKEDQAKFHRILGKTWRNRYRLPSGHVENRYDEDTLKFTKISWLLDR